VDHRALDDALEPRRRLRIGAPVRDEVGEFRVDVFNEVAPQDVEIDVAGAHDGRSVLIVDQRQKEMFERGVLVPPFAREGESSVEGLFETARKARQGLISLNRGRCFGYFFSMTH
jgi:hypothetical protein